MTTAAKSKATQGHVVIRRAEAAHRKITRGVARGKVLVGPRLRRLKIRA